MNIYKRIKGILLSERVTATVPTNLSPSEVTREKTHSLRHTRGNPQGGRLGRKAVYDYDRRRKHMTTGQKLSTDAGYHRRNDPNLP